MKIVTFKVKVGLRELTALFILNLSLTLGLGDVFLQRRLYMETVLGQCQVSGSDTHK
jgi:hypothetical protein